MINCPICREINENIIYYQNNNNIFCCICMNNIKKYKYSICGDERHSLHHKCLNKYLKFNKDLNLSLPINHTYYFYFNCKIIFLIIFILIYFIKLLFTYNLIFFFF